MYDLRYLRNGLYDLPLDEYATHSRGDDGVQSLSGNVHKWHKIAMLFDLNDRHQRICLSLEVVSSNHWKIM